MKTKNKKKSIIKKILAFGGAIFCSIVCAFSLFNITDTKSMEVSADEVIASYEFGGSDICFPVLMRLYSTVNGPEYSIIGPSFSFLRFTFIVNSETVTISSSSRCYFPIERYDHSNYIDSVNGFISGSSIVLNKGDIGWQDLLLGIDGSPVINKRYYTETVFRVSSSFSGNVSKVVIGSSAYTPLEDFTSFSNYNYVRYIDFDGGYVDVVIPVSDFYNLNLSLFNYREYLLLPNFTDNDYYNQGYSNGKIVGFDDGYSKGEEKGYSDGFKSGKDEGFWEGKQSVLEGEQYSFTSLIASVVDVPVKTFTSLFNFEILGVNLSGFLTGLFTFSVVIFILKLII